MKLEQLFETTDSEDPFAKIDPRKMPKEDRREHYRHVYLLCNTRIERIRKWWDKYLTSNIYSVLIQGGIYPAPTNARELYRASGFAKHVMAEQGITDKDPLVLINVGMYKAQREQAKKKGELSGLFVYVPIVPGNEKFVKKAKDSASEILELENECARAEASIKRIDREIEQDRKKRYREAGWL